MQHSSHTTHNLSHASATTMASTLFHDDDATLDEEAFIYAMLLMSPVLSMTLKAAIELNLLEIIVNANPNTHLSPAEIATLLPTTNPDAPAILDRILRLLASFNVLTCSISTSPDGIVTRRYGPSRVSKFFTKNEDDVSLSALSFLMHDKVRMDSLYYLKDAVLEGVIPFEKAHGMTSFKYHGTDPRYSTIFNEAMRSHSTIIMKKILEKYRGFDDVRVLVDVGGGTGASLNMIVSKYPHIKGINFDMPFVIAEAPKYPGIEHVVGDMFTSVPTGDAIFMKWILHDWNDEYCIMVLKNCYKALPENGKVIVVDSILPVAPESTTSAQVAFHIDLTMLAHHLGGKERNENEFKTLAKEAGFRGCKALFSYVIVWVIEFSK